MHVRLCHQTVPLEPADGRHREMHVSYKTRSLVRRPHTFPRNTEAGGMFPIGSTSSPFHTRLPLFARPVCAASRIPSASCALSDLLALPRSLPVLGCAANHKPALHTWKWWVCSSPGRCLFRPLFRALHMAWQRRWDFPLQVAGSGRSYGTVLPSVCEIYHLVGCWSC